MTIHYLQRDAKAVFPTIAGTCAGGPLNVEELEVLQRLETPLRSPQSAEAVVPRLNLQTLQALRDLAEPGEEDPLREFVEIFCADSPVRLQEMREAIALRHTPKLKCAAHAFKGSSSNVGAEQLAALCKIMETEALTPDWPKLESLLQSVEAEFDQVRSALQEAVDAL